MSGIQGFYQFYYDFWDTYFIARNMVATIPGSWFNQKYPVGYTLLLKFISGNGSPVLPAIILNSMIGATIVFICGYAFKKLLSKPAFLFCSAALALYPTLFHYFTVGGGDPGAVLFFAAGSAMICIALFEQNRSSLPFFIAGLLMGTAALFRYHVLPAALLFLIIFTIIYRPYFRQFLIAVLALWIAYLPQIVVNLASGHGPFETQFSPMNAYDLMYSLSWHQTITFDMPKSALTIIEQAPWLFIQKYLKVLVSFSPCYLPQIAAYFLEKDKNKRQFLLAASIFSFLYFIIFSTFTSGRQGLIILPIALLCTGILIESLILRLGTMTQKRVFSVVLTAIIVVLIFKDFQKIHRRAAHYSVYKKAETALTSAGCKSAQEIFTPQFSFYLPSLPPYVPYYNDVTPYRETYKFKDEYPRFPVKGGDDFITSCREHGVRFLIMSCSCKQPAPIFSEIYRQKHKNFELIFKHGPIKIFKLRFELTS
jgi:hypothetical protein